MRTTLCCVALTVTGIAFFAYLFGSLLWEALPAFRQLGFDFLISDRWHFHSARYGALSMIYGTCTVAFIALGIACPLGLGAAIFISEYLSGKLRAAAKVTIELLAGVPSVVYGLLGIAYFRDWIYEPFAPFGALSGDSLLTGGVLLALMILPTMMTFSDDSLRCVSRKAREAGWGLGLSREQTIWHVVLPQARHAICGAIILSLGRAIGETIAVYLVVGRADRPLPQNLFSFSSLLGAGQTLTTKLGGAEIAIAYGDPDHWSSLMALGVCLWVIVSVLTWISGYLLRLSVMKSHA